MTYYQIIRNILKREGKGIPVQEIHKKVREKLSTCPIERIYITLKKMEKRGHIIKKREGMYNYYKWVEVSNKYKAKKNSYDRTKKSLDNSREFQNKRSNR